MFFQHLDRCWGRMVEPRLAIKFAQSRLDVDIDSVIALLSG